MENEEPILYYSKNLDYKLHPSDQLEFVLTEGGANAGIGFRLLDPISLRYVTPAFLSKFPSYVPSRYQNAATGRLSTGADLDSDFCEGVHGPRYVEWCHELDQMLVDFVFENQVRLLGVSKKTRESIAERLKPIFKPNVSKKTGETYPPSMHVHRYGDSEESATVPVLGPDGRSRMDTLPERDSVMRHSLLYTGPIVKNENFWNKHVLCGSQWLGPRSAPDKWANFAIGNTAGMEPTQDVFEPWQ